MPSPVFISYRRSDAQHVTGRLFDHLSPKFIAAADVFMDTEAIASGANFESTLSRQLTDTQVCVVMIGPRWLEANADGARRIDDPNDWVRQEVAIALAHNVTVIPVLVDNARMPTAAELPEPLKPLAARNAFNLMHERFNADADELARRILLALGRSPDTELDVLKLLFSFKGTIGRKQFWIGMIALAIVQFAIFAGIIVLAGVPMGKGILSMQNLDTKIKLLVHLATIWVWWPALALTWKRVKDLGHGLGLFAPFAGVTALQIGLDLAGANDEALTMSIVSLVMLLLLGSLKGTRFVSHKV